MRAWAVCLAGPLLGLVPGIAAGQTAPCQENCQAEHERVRKQLDQCLRQVDPRPPDRAAKMRLLCYQRHSPRRCEGLPPCRRNQPKPQATTGMSIGKMIFSATKRGPALSRPSYAPGDEVFLRVDIEVRPKPAAGRVWLRMDLRLLAVTAGNQKNRPGSRVVARWDSYAEEQRVIDPAERGLPLRFTLHGGAALPVDIDPGSYEFQADVVEKASELKQTVEGVFEVRRVSPAAPHPAGRSAQHATPSHL